MRLRFTPSSQVWLGLAGICYLLALLAFATGTVPEETRRMSWLSPGPLADLFGDYAVVGNWALGGTAAVVMALYEMSKAKD